MQDKQGRLKVSHFLGSLRFGLLTLALVIQVLVIQANFAFAQSEQRIAAIVNDDIVSNQDLVERITLALLFSGLEQTENTRQQVAPQVLQRMIDERLQMQEADRLNIQVSENELIRALNDIAEPNNMTAQELITVLSQEGITAETLRAQARAEIAWVKTVRQLLRPLVVVSEAQLDMVMAVEQNGGPEEFLISEIILPIYEIGEEEAVRANALELRDSIREGADFGNLARQFSVASTAGDGGDIGWMPLERLSPTLQPAVAGLGVGQLSDPIRTPAGMHLMLVRDRRQSQNVAADPQARRLAQLFLPYAANGAASAELIETEAARLRQQLNSCGDIVSAAAQLGLPASGDLGWIIPADMPTSLGQVVAGLAVGSVSEPVRSDNGVHLLAVCQLGGSVDDEAAREETRRLLEREQIERLATRYLRDLRKDGFIDVRVRF